MRAVLLTLGRSLRTMVTTAQDAGLPSDFLGISTDGPSREGFYFAPAYRVHDGRPRHANGEGLPHIYPDGTAHAWSLEYSPGGAGGRGEVTVRLGKEEVKPILPRIVSMPDESGTGPGIQVVLPGEPGYDS